MSMLLEEIRHRLAALQPSIVELEDESARHAGHAGAAAGGGHFKLYIVARIFAGQSKLARHRTVYDTLGNLIPHRIHAISIDARTPDENAR